MNKTTFPESASNNEWARFLYYLGRIKAIQLEYTEAHKNLVQSLRKAPQKSAVGFRHTVLKLSITVELLLGNIPERQTFLQPSNKKALAPYLLLTQGTYRASHVLVDLGWIDLDLGSSPGWWAAFVPSCTQARWWNMPNLSQPNPVANLMLPSVHIIVLLWIQFIGLQLKENMVSYGILELVLILDVLN